MIEAIQSPTRELQRNIVLDTNWAPDLTRCEGPKYLALSHALREAIRDGRLAPGVQLPPVRDLAWALKVTPGTVARAYQAEVTPDGRRQALNGGIVGFFSLEMSAEQLATRIIAEQSGVSSYKIRRGDIQQGEFERVVEASRRMQTVPLYIDQTGGISIAQLAARARRLKRQRGLDVLVVDYLQLLSGASKKSDNRVQEMTEITTGMKALAKELDVPIIALSQLSRQVENRDDKRPQLSDLRESGSIEQDADVVMFVFREEYYLKNKQPREGTEEFIKWQTEMERAHGRAEVIIGKQRHGPTGTVELQFDAEVTRFGDLAQDDRMPQRMD